MPTELKLEAFIPGVTAKDYYRVLLHDELCIKRFHHEVNGDPDASATEWEDGERTVTFNMTIKAPAMVKSIIGTGVIRVAEVSKLTWKGSSSFEIVSEPLLDFPAANKFTTSGQTIVSDARGGCQVDVILRCTAALPWPMQGTVEGIMASEGKATVGKYLEFCRQALEEDKNNRVAAAAVEAAPAAATSAAAAGVAATSVPQANRAGPALHAAAAPSGARQQQHPEEDSFFDAVEEIADAEAAEAAAATAGGAAAASGQRQQRQQAAGPLTVHEPLGRDEVAVRCLLAIQASCTESAALLRQVAQALQRMDANIAAIHDAVLVNTKAPSSVAAKAAAAARPAAGWGGLQQQPPTGPAAAAGASSLSYRWGYVLVFGLATTALVSAAVIKAKQRTGA